MGLRPLKRVVLVVAGTSLVLTVALSANAAPRHATVAPVQKAETCIRAALRHENLFIKYVEEGKLTRLALHGALSDALVDLKCAINATRAAGALDDITVAESKDIREDLHDAYSADNDAAYAGLTGPKAIAEVKRANVFKHKALAGLIKATAPPPPPVTTPGTGSFTISLTHIFGAGPTSTNDCETVTVQETGINMTPTGTLNLTGPGGFDKTNPLTFGPNGTGVFAAPTTFLFTQFGSYTEKATVSVNGTTQQQTGTFTLDASNDKTTAGCGPP
jgi:hypothetical protein